MRTAPGVLVAAPRSGSGKTTVVLGLQRALVRRGLRVRGVKCGPDYIDPAFHAAATGRPSYNLDSLAMPDALLAALAAESAADADILVAEGSMGLFDGVPGPPGRTGASADIAARLGWPVLLVLDVSGHAQSAGAVALGCARFDPRIQVAGVVLNQVASERHRRLAADGIARAGLPLLGAVPRDRALTLPERHLGLVQAVETADLSARLDRLADAVEAAVDLDAVLRAAGLCRLSGPGGPGSTDGAAVGTDGASCTARPIDAGTAFPAALPPSGQRVALARDAAFSFAYPHVLEGWRRSGAELVPFSPLADEPPPESCDACWLPGGYPELHAGCLAAAGRFLAGLRRFAATRAVHGECGGYMVLGRALTDADGTAHAMAGLLPVETSYAKRRLHLGYRRATLLRDGALGPAGARLVGHEFHYASVAGGEAPTTAGALAEVADGEGNPLGPAGHQAGRVSGTFFHAIATA